jgi:hypothetical protein
VVPEQGYCPFDGLVTEWLGTMAHGGAKQILKFLVPDRGPIPAAAVDQGGGIPTALKALDPMVDCHSTGAQESSGLRDRTPTADFEDREDTAKQARITCGSQHLLEPTALGCCQLQPAHGTPRLTEGTTTKAEC